MAIAIDTSILLDVLLEGSTHGESSKNELKRCSSQGLIVCEAVIAELLPVADGDALVVRQLLSDWNIEFDPIGEASAYLAGQMFSTFLKRGGKRGRVLPDFLIGAHARLQATAILARDQGYYRDYFKGLVVIDPSAT